MGADTSPAGCTDGTITGLLARARSGDALASERLFATVYGDLRRLARRQLRRCPADPLQTTAVANAACERLLGRVELNAEDRRHFFFLLDRAMRDVVVEQARANGAKKRGGSLIRVPFSDLPAAERSDPLDVVELDKALTELAVVDAEAARVVELRFFGGRTLHETAEILGCTLAIVRKNWDYAKSWLHHRLSP